MFLAYDGIVFDVLLLNGWNQEAVWSEDGADFLYWHHVIDVTAVLAPNVVAADFIPPAKPANLNKAIRARQKAEADRRAAATRQAQDLGLIPPGATIPGQPIRTPIPVPPVWKPRTDIDVTDGSYIYTDAAGNVSQAAEPDTPNYPTVPLTRGAVPYDTDLAPKTSPVQEGGISGVIQPQSQSGTLGQGTLGAIVSPGTLKDSSVGQYEDHPERQLEVTPQLDLRGPRARPERRKTFPAPNDRLPATENELRDRLDNPRRQLKIWVNTGPRGAPEFMLSLPYDGCQMDAKDGPKCINQHMAAIHGNVTGVKRLVFEAFEAPPLTIGPPTKSRNAPNMPGVPPGMVIRTPPIMSNRWTMTQVPDQQTYLNSTVIEGTARFRLDVLSRLGMTADQLRTYIMPPLALGYTRRPTQVSILSTGDTIKYTIVDDQQMMNNPSGMKWGVHSVVVVNSCVANNPLDVGVHGPSGAKMQAQKG